jgi:hypothetical protein
VAPSYVLARCVQRFVGIADGARVSAWISADGRFVSVDP